MLVLSRGRMADTVTHLMAMTQGKCTLIIESLIALTAKSFFLSGPEILGGDGEREMGDLSSYLLKLALWQLR